MVASVCGWGGRECAEFRGKLTNRFDSQSIYNTFGTYGSRYSDRSAFNPFASHPPVLVKGATVLAYVTVNRFKTPHVTPQGAETGGAVVCHAPRGRSRRPIAASCDRRVRHAVLLPRNSRA
jgi:hypothetical protein